MLSSFSCVGSFPRIPRGEGVTDKLIYAGPFLRYGPAIFLLRATEKEKECGGEGKRETLPCELEKFKQR